MVSNVKYKSVHIHPTMQSYCTRKMYSLKIARKYWEYTPNGIKKLLNCDTFPTLSSMMDNALVCIRKILPLDQFRKS